MKSSNVSILSSAASRPVLADGCFDPLHMGHLEYLRAAAMVGHPVIVRIAPDADIVAKGRTPFQTQEERARLIMALGIADFVVCHDSLAEAILDIRPHALVKGADWIGRALPPDVLRALDEIGTDLVYTTTASRSSAERLAG